MKTYTFKEVIRLLVDGKIIKDKDGDLWQLKENGFEINQVDSGSWGKVSGAVHASFAPFTLYEEPKNKYGRIIQIAKSGQSGKQYHVLGEDFYEENDAIRAAMEYLLGCKRLNVYNYPAYLPFGLADKTRIHTALFHRWPIEVIEE